MITTNPRGTFDVLPADAGRWRRIEEVFLKACREYGYEEIRTPIFEHTELFERGVGDTTDIVQKEMYTFLDRGKRSITLRPEGTAPLVRAYLENGLFAGTLPVKLLYIGPMFRYDKPQAGRYKQFHQVGAEALGSASPAVDAEVIALAMDFYGRLGLKDLELHINSVGCPVCRPELKTRLKDWFGGQLDGLCPDCRSRYDKNPLRILDCKNQNCCRISQGAPTSLDTMCSGCRLHFDRVRDYLDRLGIVYTVNSRLVRGLDYYTNTAFEVMAPDIGAQSSIGGGGRYDGLVEACGGDPAPGVGFALGIERTLLAMERQGVSFPARRGPDVFVACAEEVLEPAAFEILFSLRKNGLPSDKDYMGRSLKAQMKFAGRAGCRCVVILGGDEYRRGLVVIRDMTRGVQEEVPVAAINGAVKKMVRDMDKGEDNNQC